MKTLILAAIRCSLMLLVPTVAFAISAQWDLDPISGDWNTPANWTPNDVPNGPLDIATFDLSHTTDVSISANTEVNGITFTAAATNPYTITASAGLTLTISGAGITNNSGVGQGLTSSGENAEIIFSNSATAASNVFILNEPGGSTNFFNSSTAGSSNISNVSTSSTNFFNSSTADHAVIANEAGSSTNFFNSSTAGSSSISNVSTSSTNFFNSSTAGHAVISGFDASFVSFYNSSSAGSATIGTAGDILFFDSSTAGSANIAVGSVFIVSGLLFLRTLPRVAQRRFNFRLRLSLTWAASST